MGIDGGGPPRAAVVSMLSLMALTRAASVGRSGQPEAEDTLASFDVEDAILRKSGAELVLAREMGRAALSSCLHEKWGFDAVHG
jgi:hypothetical protein